MASLEEMMRQLLTEVSEIKRDNRDIKNRLVKLENGTSALKPDSAPVILAASPKPPALAAAVASTSKDDSSSEASDLDMFHNTGLPKTPAPKVKHRVEEDAKEDRPARRHSIHLHGLTEAEKHSSHVMVYGQREPYDHIRLKSTSAQAFFAFFEAVVVYQRRTKTNLEIPTLLSDDVRDQVIAIDPVKYGDLKFYDLTLQELYSALQSIFRPRSKLAFVKAMTSHVNFVFSANYRPTAEYFLPFYNALLAYRNLFMKFYDIFALDNDTNLPQPDFKEYGALKLFTSKIPFEYGSRTVARLTSTKWSTLHAFLRDFYGMVENDKLSSEEARKVRESFGGTQYEAQKFDGQKQHRVQTLQDVTPARAYGHEDDLEYTDEWLAQQLEDAETIEFEHELAAMQYPNTAKPSSTPASAGPREPFVCIIKALYGVCNKAGCKWDHREENVHKTRVKYVDLLQKQLAQAKSSPALRAPPRFGQRAANVAEVDTDNNDEEY